MDENLSRKAILADEIKPGIDLLIRKHVLLGTVALERLFIPILEHEASQVCVRDTEHEAMKGNPGSLGGNTTFRNIKLPALTMAHGPQDLVAKGLPEGHTFDDIDSAWDVGRCNFQDAHILDGSSALRRERGRNRIKGTLLRETSEQPKSGKSPCHPVITSNVFQAR